MYKYFNVKLANGEHIDVLLILFVHPYEGYIKQLESHPSPLILLPSSQFIKSSSFKFTPSPHFSIHSPCFNS